MHESKRYLDGEPLHNKESNRSIKQERDFLLYKLDELEQVKCNLKAELNAQRRLVTELQSEKTNRHGERSDLENIFLDCVEQVRQDIRKRKTFQTTASEYDAPSNGRQSNKNFRKTPLAKSDGLYTPGTRGSTSMGLRKASKQANTFMSSDKSKVIELLMQNDQVLLFLYEKLFPMTSTQSHSMKSGLAASGVSLGADRLYSAEGFVGAQSVKAFPR